MGEGRAWLREMPLAGVSAWLREMPLAGVSAWLRGRGVRKHLRGDARPSLLAPGLICGMLALGCSGCAGGSKRPPKPLDHVKPWKPGKPATARTNVCTTAGRAAFARVVRVAPHAVRERRTVARSGAAECVFRAGRVVASVAVNGAPEAFAVLERQAEEQAQIFGAKRFTPAPQLILGLGADAYWFPAQQQVMTTEGVNLVTATIVHWPHTPTARRRALGKALDRPYLGKIDQALLRGPAP